MPAPGDEQRTVPMDGDQTPLADDRRRASDGRRPRVDLEVVAAIILSVVTILTAWSAFEATKWGGVMAIRFSEAAAARTEATQAAARVNAKQAVDVGLFVEYAAARSADDTVLADFLEDRFRDEFRPAFEVWLAQDPLRNPNAPATPFELDEYVIVEEVEAAEATATADLRAQQARDANQTGDNYVLTTVLFASVLFFAGVSTKFDERPVQLGLLAVAIVLLIAGGALLLSFPVEI